MQQIDFTFAAPLLVVGVWFELLATHANADTLHRCTYTEANCAGDGFCSLDVMTPKSCITQLRLLGFVEGDSATWMLDDPASFQSVVGGKCNAGVTIFGMSTSNSVHCTADDGHLELLQIKDTWRRQCFYSNADCTEWIGEGPNCAELNYAEQASWGSDVCTALCATASSNCGACIPWTFDGASNSDIMTFRTTCGLPSGELVEYKNIMGSHFYDRFGNLTTTTTTITTITTTTTTTIAPATVTMTVVLDVDIAMLSPTNLQSAKKGLLNAAIDAGGFNLADVETIELVQRAPTPPSRPPPTPAPTSTTQPANTTATTTTSAYACGYDGEDFAQCEDYFGGMWSDLVRCGRTEGCIGEDYGRSCCSSPANCRICFECGSYDGQAVNDLLMLGEFSCRNGASAKSTGPANLVSTPGMINHPINATIVFNVYSTYGGDLVRIDLDPTIWTLQDGSETAVAGGGFTVDVSLKGRNDNKNIISFYIVAVVDEMTFFISESSPGKEESVDKSANTEDVPTPDDTLCPAGTFVFDSGSRCCLSNSDGSGKPLTYTGTTCANNDYIMADNSFSVVSILILVGIFGGGLLLICLFACTCWCLCCKKGQNKQPEPTMNNANYSPHSPDGAATVVAVVAVVPGDAEDAGASADVGTRAGIAQTIDVANADGAPTLVPVEGTVDSDSGGTLQVITRCPKCHAKTQFCMCNMSNNHANTSV